MYLVSIGVLELGKMFLVSPLRVKDKYSLVPLRPHIRPTEQYTRGHSVRQSILTILHARENAPIEPENHGFVGHLIPRGPRLDPDVHSFRLCHHRQRCVSVLVANCFCYSPDYHSNCLRDGTTVPWTTYSTPVSSATAPPVTTTLASETTQAPSITALTGCHMHGSTQ